MSGAIIFCSGGPITWKTDCQEQTALSSCELEICATNMGLRLTVNICNMISHLSSLGYPISDATTPTPLFNDNEACVQWCHNMTTKGNCHIENRENSVRKWVEDGTLTVTHISGKCNPADIFTKEMQDGANFCCLHDPFMCQSSDFVQHIFNTLHPLTKPLDTSTIDHIYVAHSANYIQPQEPGYLDVLISQPSLCFSLQSHAYQVLDVTYYLVLHLLCAGHYEQSYGGVTVGYSYHLPHLLIFI
jgi:hypothetical protein